MYGAAFALLISFVALRILWPKPRLAKLSEGHELPTLGPTAVTVFRGAVRALGLFLFVVVFYAAVGGVDDAGFNIAPYALYVGFWVGLIIVCALLGDVYSIAN